MKLGCLLVACPQKSQPPGSLLSKDLWALIKLCEGLLTALPEKLPNMHRPQNLVNSLMPESSKLSKSIRPKEAQNNVCVVSHKLKLEKVNLIFCPLWHGNNTYLANFLKARQWLISITISLLSFSYAIWKEKLLFLIIILTPGCYCWFVYSHQVKYYYYK